MSLSIAFSCVTYYFSTIFSLFNSPFVSCRIQYRHRSMMSELTDLSDHMSALGMKDS